MALSQRYERNRHIMITKKTLGAIGLQVMEQWSAHFDYKMVTKKATYYFESDAIDKIGAIRVVNHNGSSSFEDGSLTQYAWMDTEILTKLGNGEYESIDFCYETEVEKDIS
jgi:hypothetical protein